MQQLLKQEEPQPDPTRWWRWPLGRATRWQHWLGRLLYTSFAAALYISITHRGLLWGVFRPQGLPFSVMGVIFLLLGFGVELYPQEVWEREENRNPGRFGTIFPEPGHSKMTGAVLLALGLTSGFF